MKILYDKNGYLLGKSDSEWSDTFETDMYGVYKHGTETSPVYQGKNLKDCVDWMKSKNIITESEALILMENYMTTNEAEDIVLEIDSITEPPLKELKALEDEKLPDDAELFSCECRTCHGKFDLLTCRWDGEGNVICSKCGAIN